MRLLIEIAATIEIAALVCITATPAARCAAIKRQCGGKFYANACGDKLLAAN